MKYETGMVVKVRGPYIGKDINDKEQFGFDEITGIMVIDQIVEVPFKSIEYCLVGLGSSNISGWVFGDSRFTKYEGKL